MQSSYTNVYTLRFSSFVNSELASQLYTTVCDGAVFKTTNSILFKTRRQVGVNSGLIKLGEEPGYEVDVTSCNCKG